MKQRVTPLLIAGVFLLSACGTITKTTSKVTEKVVGTGTSETLIPDRTFQITPGLGISLEKMVYWGAYAAVAYLILDPWAPNWEIEEARLSPELVHFNLKMKRYYAGGAGEARVVFNRRAKDLMRAGDFASYQILEYNEGMESSVLGSQRITEGVIKLIPKACPGAGVCT